MTRIVVTGAAGYIGWPLVSLLRKKHEVLAIDDFSYNYRDYYAAKDVEVIDVVCGEARARIADFVPDVVVHLAGISGNTFTSSDVTLARSSMLGTASVAQVSQQVSSIKRLVVVSPATYFSGGEEKDLSRYHAASRSSSIFAESFDGDGLQVTNLVVGSVYGPSMPKKSFSRINTILEAILGNSSCLSIDGNSSTVDHVYIDDVVSALSKAADLSRVVPLRMDIGTGYPVSDMYLAHLISRELDKTSPIEVKFNFTDTPSMRTLDLSTAIKALDWIPRTNLHVGISRVVSERLVENA